MTYLYSRLADTLSSVVVALFGADRIALAVDTVLGADSVAVEPVLAALAVVAGGVVLAQLAQAGDAEGGDGEIDGNGSSGWTCYRRWGRRCRCCRYTRRADSRPL